MFPLPLPGIALAGKMLLSKYANPSLSKQRKVKPPFPLKIRPIQSKTYTLSNPLVTLINGLSSSLSQIRKTTPKEDYTAVVRGFLPENAVLVTPQYPVGIKEMQWMDLDGDAENELVASYRVDGQISTMILKKQKEQWEKIAEISEPNYDTLHYIGSSDIAGEGKNQLLVGRRSKEGPAELHVYSLENGETIQRFTRAYHRMQILEPSSKDRANSRASLAVWDQKDLDEYDIQVLRFNNGQLEPLNNVAPYYSGNVVPYYIQKVRQDPASASNWYNLANALEKSGAFRDALIATEIGMGQELEAPLKEKFLTLRKKLLAE